MTEPIAPSLDSLGLKYGTDKASGFHDYLVFYERHFAPLRYANLQILEVGVFGGASLRTWAEYFPNARIIGADIDFRARQHRAPRIEIELLDQSNVQDLVDLGLKYGTFDIVIEDGSHMWEHQTTTLKTLFPFVKPRGFYVVEDLQTNYGDLTKVFKGAATESCMDYLKRLVDLRVADQQIDITATEDPFLRSYGRAVESMTFYRRACLIEKGPDFRPSPTNMPLTELEWDTHALPLSLVAHIGHVGDRDNRRALFLSAACYHQHIQGFALLAPEDLAAGVEYRVRLPNGAWTAWVQGNAFAGSRGRAQDLTGYAVRLTGALEQAFELTAFGAFTGEEGVVRAGGGEDCVPDGLKPMSALHIVVKRRKAETA
jgi:hypothetical protein